MVQESPISRLLLIRQHVVHPEHQMSLIGLVPNFNLCVLNLNVAVSQRQLFMVYPLLNIQGNCLIRPSLPIPYKELPAFNYSIPDV